VNDHRRRGLRRTACPILATTHAVVASALIAASPATADMLDFNDLGPSSGGTLMPAIYGGLRWQGSSWHYMTAPSGNTFLALSLPNTIVRIAPNGPEFTFHGMEVWSRRGADALGDFYFFLYHNGQTVYNGFEDPDGRQRFNGTPQFFTPNYKGPVDAFAIGFDNDDHDHIAIDGLSISFAPSCTADLDGSGAVQGGDLALLLAAWGQPGTGDIDGDGFVAGGDLAMMLAAWGNCP
jgi:hypothetical protein